MFKIASTKTVSSASKVPAVETLPQAPNPQLTVQQLFDLKGRFAVVTGGARGLGIELGTALIEANCNVALLDIQPAAVAEEFDPLLALAKSKGLSLTYHICNVTSAESVATAFEQVKKLSVEVDAPLRVLVHCAGIQHEAAAVDYKEADFNRVMQVNVTGTMLVAQAAAKEMIHHGLGGSMILIASMSGHVTNKGNQTTAYNSSKAAVHQLGRSVAAEWGAHNIRVNTLSPGYILTAMTAGLLAHAPEKQAKWASENPLGRISIPSEFKGPCVFLASDASSFMTATDLRVDGGHCSF